MSEGFRISKILLIMSLLFTHGLQATIGARTLSLGVGDSLPAFESAANTDSPDQVRTLFQAITKTGNPTKHAREVTGILPAGSLNSLYQGYRDYLETTEGRARKVEKQYRGLSHNTFREWFSWQDRQTHPFVRALGSESPLSNFLGYPTPLSDQEHKAIIQSAIQMALLEGHETLLIVNPSGFALDEALSWLTAPHNCISTEMDAALYDGSYTPQEPSLSEIMILGPFGSMLGGYNNQTFLYQSAMRLRNVTTLRDLHGHEIPKLHTWFIEEKHRVIEDRKKEQGKK